MNNKRKFKFFKSGTLLLLLSVLLIGARLEAQTCSGVLPPATVNGVDVTQSYTGDVIASWNAGIYTGCAITMPAIQTLIGAGGVGSYTYYFSQPVNNLELLFGYLQLSEVNTFITNSGTPSLSLPFNCNASVSGNQLVNLSVSNSDGLVIISNSVPFTSLTITNNGLNGGSAFVLCSNSVFSACQAGSTAPPLSATSVSNVCPAATANLTTLHTGTVPSGASLVWFTNSAHTGVAYATPTAATAGTYYAFYYDAVNNCYSPASAAVTVSITACCNAGSVAPVITP